MGLDMYLEAKKYIPKDNLLNKQIRDIIPEMKQCGNLDYIKLSFEIGYWRKANAIHKWIVENIQGGKDDCGDYGVSREQLIKLKELCQKAIKSKTPQDILPTTEGFFFGSTEYDEGYKADLKETIKIVDRCLALSDDWEFVYNSSW